MKRYLSAVIVTSVYLFAGAAAADDMADLLQLESRWNQAYAEHDTETIAGLLANDFMMVDGHGAVLDKAALLKMVADRRASFDPIRNDDVVVRIYGDMAVVTGRFNLSMRYDAQPYSFVFRFTDVWRREGGSWLAVSSQVTPVQPPSKS